MKRKLAFFLTLVMLFTTCLNIFPALAETRKYSVRWYQTDDSVWHIVDSNGALIKNTWLLDDECDVEGGLWYLIDENGDMVSDPFMVDGQGRYYSFQQEHDGHFGTMRVTDGVYHGVNLTFSHTHDGSYGSITNPEGIEAMKTAVGLKERRGIINPKTIRLSELRVGVASFGSVEDPEPDRYYSVSFNMNGVDVENPEDFKPITVRKGSELEEPATPVDSNGKKVFTHWSSRSVNEYDFENETYTVENSLKLYACWREEDCVLEGTLITLADGTQKPVEDLTADDSLLVYDFFEGRMVSRKLLGNVRSEREADNIIRLKTKNGNELAIVGAEAVFDMDAKTFVDIDAGNYQDVIGMHVMINDNGHYGIDEIVETSLSVEKAVFYEVYTEYNRSYIANNILTNYPFYFELEYYPLDDNYKVDAEEYAKILDTCGLYTYDQFADIMSEEFFEKFHVAKDKYVAEKSGIPFTAVYEAYTGFEQELNDSIAALK